jgi:hypothetical protein
MHFERFIYPVIKLIDMSVVQETIGQFLCAMTRRHIISDSEEDRLYDSESGEIDATCSRCGLPVHLKIESKHKDVYSLSRIK